MSSETDSTRDSCQIYQNEQYVIIPTEVLQEDLERVVNELGRIPRRNEYDKYGDYSSQTLKNRFSSDNTWETTVENLGYSHSFTHSRYVPTDDMREDLERVLSDLEPPILAKEYAEHGDHSPEKVADRLADGTWAGLMRQLGYTPIRERNISLDRIRDDFARLLDDFDELISITRYNEYGKYSADLVKRKFGDDRAWPSSAAEIVADTTTHISDSELRKDFHSLINGYGRLPRKEDYIEHGQYNVTIPMYRMGDGTWTSAVEELRKPMDPPDTPTPSDVVADIQRVAHSHGSLPDKSTYADLGQYDADTVESQFGTGDWEQLLQLCNTNT